jgi:hypothetical protein
MPKPAARFCPHWLHIVGQCRHGIVVVPARLCCGFLVACADEDMNVDGAGTECCFGEQVWQPAHCE